MASDREPVRFVTASAVRSEVVTKLGESRVPTQSLLETLDASTSAVYSSLSELEQRGLIRSAEEGWELTGSGRLVADMVRQRERYGHLFGDMEEYLQTHDTTPLPRALRLRIGALAGGDVLYAPERAPNRAVEEVSNRLGRAETARVVSPIYVESYAEATFDAPRSRIVLDEEVVPRARDASSVPEGGYEFVETRVAEVDFALGVTGSEVLLSLPTLDGSYDAQSEVIAEHAPARRWGEDLFERYWRRGVPIDQFANASE